MTAASDKLAESVMRLLPAPIERLLRTDAGNRFIRFVPAALAAVVTSQVVLVILTGPVQLGGFTSGVLASMTAAGVSYILSRWAWDRKGRPDLLRETLPFWAVSIAVWIVLGLTTHFANTWATSSGLHHLNRHLVVNGAYLLMNCVTFVTRFLIFHYVLFAKKGMAVELSPSLAAAEAMAAAEAESAGKDRRSEIVPGDEVIPPRIRS